MSGDALHGEYKVPGGKLVVVDLEVAGGRISAFRLAGDFFVEPDETVPAIEAAVLAIPGVVDTGLFLGMASVVLVGEPGQVRELKR